MRIARLLGLVVLVGGLAARLPAQIVVGTANNSNCVPFICFAGGANNGYAWQEVYSSSPFGSSSIDITALTFYSTLYPAAGSLDGNTYTVHLSTVSFGVGSFPQVTDPTSNVGPDNTQVFNGVLSGPVGAGTGFTLTFATPFLYNPLSGNLLLDVRVSGPNSIPNNGLNAYLDSDNSGTFMQREFWLNPVGTLGRVDNGPLVTGFDTAAPISTVPEPATMTLLATGLVGMVAARRRRKA